MSNQLTFDELRAYQAGQLSGPARHRVERALLEDPFYADALAGLEAMQQAARPTPEQLSSLRDALQDRIHASATKKRLWHLWIATITAALLFVFAVAIYMIYFMPKKMAKPAPVAPQTSLKTTTESGAYYLDSVYWKALV
ncbi:hypothetical protein CLV58_102218 [Spirosoma oryzae]|uniref:Uncharacterized protein n=1 Tax=Spirosoma oryzae TaxID=1469603 RepID=A0A2T0TIL6_9BACT|nr:hypothetical protein [Spirosoma oryzae]PRY45469.1 hypothetical protein CLV58_102218 [Spirosoma oryzae]